MHQRERFTFSRAALHRLARYLAPAFVSISNYIREKVSGLVSRDKFDMDMGSRISPPISFPRLFHGIRFGNRRDAPAFPNTFSGDRTASDLSQALISRLSDRSKAIYEPAFATVYGESSFSKRCVKIEC